MNRPANIIMINSATSAEISNVFVNNNCASVTLQITGTFTSATVALEGLVNLNSDAWTSIGTFNLSNFAVDTDGMDSKKIYQAAIEGIPQVRINVLSVTGGNITVVCQFGNAVIDPFSPQNMATLIPNIGAATNNIAPEYIPGTYSLNNLVIHEGLLYKCKTAIATAESWNSSKWERTTIAEYLSTL